MAAPRKPRHAPLWPVALVALAVGFVLFLALTFAGSFGIHIESGYPFGTPTPHTTLPTPPAPIIDTDATVVSGNAVTLQWSTVTGASNYVIVYEGYKPPPSNEFTWGHEETESMSHMVVGLFPGVAYTFHVYAHGDGVRYSDGSQPAVVEVQIPPDDDMSDEGGVGSYE